MATTPNNSTSPLSPPPSDHHSKSNITMLYYGLIVIGIAAIVLILYNLLIIRWCSDTRRMMRTGQNRLLAARNVADNLGVSSFRYKKDEEEKRVGVNNYECVVCLCVFEDGEELRQLPKCKHCFHAPCIDMWLSSHLDCPLCRSPVDPPPPPLDDRRKTMVEHEENTSQEGLLVLVGNTSLV